MNSADVVILGGGLAGLVAGIHLLKSGATVCLIEKDSYPRHRVCGEYLSNEVKPYLNFLGVDLQNTHVPELSRLEFSTAKGNLLECTLELGGLGISRYTLDHLFFQQFLKAGGKFMHTTAENCNFQNDEFLVNCKNGHSLKANFVIGAYGKRSNLDKNLDRGFINKRSAWIAVKAHYDHQRFPDDLVALHNFNGGYCGLSKTDLGTVNVCYLATYESFQKHGKIKDFEHKVLSENPYLNDFFRNSTLEFEKPLSIAQISFDSKTQVEDHILMIGDAAGLVHPLSGNGMAMAIRSAKLVSEALLKFELNPGYRTNIASTYIKSWKQNFSSRMRTGRILQKVLLHERMSDITQGILQRVPGLLPKIIKKTHGKEMHV
ncbi:NAD(P)/FAD-dependent oxidoreductase [Christiangramia portivictoriae]|uniref:NAD(P)/FAD-dependent oxidoreductase n=1 Tax=Christiangramia portivictoriae TaxID=326069 RepID=UPI00047AB894|nr:NAD(P)/FAD-dependent oxidoreductase [Christiangramia portivictoriae]